MDGSDWRHLSVKPAVIEHHWFNVVNRNRVDAVEAIRSGIPNVVIGDTQNAVSSLNALFDLQKPTHCFSARPHSWAHLLEPQITRGFVHFLNQGDERRRSARCMSFVKAALGLSAFGRKVAEGWWPTSVCAEAEENRIDVLVELTDGHKRFGAAIEAKFGHKLTKGQLEKAEEHATNPRSRAWDPARSAFLVIAPLTTRIDRRLLDKRPNWRAISWWAFLNRLEREIDDSQDCGDYRRFRRTVWHRSY